MNRFNAAAYSCLVTGDLHISMNLSNGFFCSITCMSVCV
jgi:hypothetical protein